MGKGTVVAALVVLVLIAGGAYALTSSTNDDSKTSGNTGESAGTNKNTEVTNETQSTVASAVITYDGSSFSPSKVTVKSGEKITIKNTSSTNVQFDSDPHPIHTDDEDLNAGLVGPGDSKDFTVTQKGSFGYHNHLNSSQKGEIVIQ